MLHYDIRYGFLKARQIYNSVGPWDHSDNDQKKKKGLEYINRVNEKKPGFYDKLEESILKEGIKNPICVVTGKLPGWQWDQMPEEAKKHGVWCPQWGGSRLFIAQKHDMMIPCLISDFAKKFTDLELVTNGNRIKELISMPIKKIIISPRGLIIRFENESHN